MPKTVKIPARDRKWRETRLAGKAVAKAAAMVFRKLLDTGTTFSYVNYGRILADFALDLRTKFGLNYRLNEPAWLRQGPSAGQGLV